MLSCMAEAERTAGQADLPGASASLRALWETTVAHFAFEEELMAEHAYPDREAHRTAHNLFLQDLDRLRRDLDRAGLSDEVANRAGSLSGWMAFHIRANDAPLALFVLRRIAARVVAGAHGEPLPRPKRSDS
jgi:hemerythrin-like metal-binding protein